MNIFIAKLNFETTESDLREAFQQFGEVESVKIVIDFETQRSKGFGFVIMPNDDEAQSAIDNLNETDLDGNTVVVKQAVPREEYKRGGSGGNRRGGGGGGYRDNRGGGGYRDNRGGGGGYNRDNRGGGGGYNRDNRGGGGGYNRDNRGGGGGYNRDNRGGGGDNRGGGGYRDRKRYDNDNDGF